MKKIIQIATSSNEEDYAFLLALCEDGKLYRGVVWGPDPHWEQIKPIEDEEDEEPPL